MYNPQRLSFRKVFIQLFVRAASLNPDPSFSCSSSGPLNMKISFRCSGTRHLWTASSASCISWSCTGSGSINSYTSLSKWAVGSPWAAYSDSDRFSSSISGLGVLGVEDSEENIPSFNQGSSSSAIACSSSTTSSISSSAGASPRSHIRSCES